MIVFGTRLFGAVDKVPTLCHVATKFFHVWYVPLVPTQSWIVLAGSERSDGWRGIEIDMSGKSVIAGYFRAATIIAALVSIFLALTTYAKDAGGAVVHGLVFAASVAMNLLLWRGRASPDRARELAAVMKLDPAIVDEIYASGPDERRS